MSQYEELQKSLEIFRQIYSDLSEQTHAVKLLSETYHNLDESIYKTKDAEKHREFVRELFERANSQIEKNNTFFEKINGKLDETHVKLEGILTKCDSYYNLTKELINSIRKESEHQKELEIIRVKNRAKLIIQIVGYILGAGGIGILILERLI